MHILQVFCTRIFLLLIQNHRSSSLLFNAIIIIRQWRRRRNMEIESRANAVIMIGQRAAALKRKSSLWWKIKSDMHSFN